MFNFLTVFLEGGFSTNTWEEIGVMFFFFSIFSFCLAVIFLLAAFIMSITHKDNSKNILKIGLYLLLFSGISLLLTSALCGWYR